MHSDTENKRIILFHPEGEDVLLRTGVLTGLDYHIYDPVKDIKYCFVNIFNASLYCLKFKPVSVSRNFFSFNYLKILAREFRAQIMLDNLRKFEPKVILTWIDNSDVFHRISKSCSDIPFLAIANSARTTWCASDALPDDESIYYIDEFFCYGARMKNMFEHYEHKIKKYIVCGSLLGGYFFSSYKKDIKLNREKYDLCVISQWHKDAWNNTVDSVFQTGNALDVLSSYVSLYASEYNIKVCIALRSHNSDEKKYFKKYFSNNCVFKECDRETFSSYMAVSSSNLVVAINSSLSVESFGAGLKVLFVNPSGQDRIKQIDSEGVWYLSEPNYIVFSKRIKLLLNMTIDEYLLEANEEIKNVMSYDFEKPAHVLCRERLLELISK